MNKAGISVCLDFIWSPALQLWSCHIHTTVVHQGFRSSMNAKRGSVLQNSVNCCAISSLPACSEAGSDHKGQTPDSITIPQSVYKSSIGAEKVLLLGSRAEVKSQFHSLIHWKPLMTEVPIFSTVWRVNSSPMCKCEDCPHQKCGFDPWTEP